MTSESIQVFRSPDHRLKAKIANTTYIAEKTAVGILISEFDNDGGVINQIYSKGVDPVSEISSHLKTGMVELVEVNKYDSVKVNAVCDKCGKKDLKRELDLVDPVNIRAVPIVPMFVCSSCTSKFYYLSNNYLKNLVEKNPHLFKEDELKEKAKDEGVFIHTLQEYIIRIFASKKINRVKFG